MSKGLPKQDQKLFGGILNAIDWQWGV